MSKFITGAKASAVALIATTNAWIHRTSAPTDPKVQHVAQKNLKTDLATPETTLRIWSSQP